MNFFFPPCLTSPSPPPNTTKIRTKMKLILENSHTHPTVCLGRTKNKSSNLIVLELSNDEPLFFLGRGCKAAQEMMRRIPWLRLEIGNWKKDREPLLLPLFRGLLFPPGMFRGLVCFFSHLLLAITYCIISFVQFWIWKQWFSTATKQFWYYWPYLNTIRMTNMS